MYELYYTSAPEGMKRGTRGFCTVAASEGIPRALFERMEALSAYRHHFGANEPTANPVACGHWILNVAGGPYHVLSRVCDSGLDYTQRTNAFAHHIALEAGELGAGGPAAMLMAAGVMAQAWDGQVGTLAPRRVPESASRAGRCELWERATGDAGYGGLLAESALKNRPVCILFSPGQELLGLIGEALALLTPTQRWGVTFNTYFTSMPTSATCLWRCCLAGTPAGVAAMRYAGSGLVLNLAEQGKRMGLEEAGAGEWVKYARTGVWSGATSAGGKPASVAKTAKEPVKPVASAGGAGAGPVTPPPVAVREGQEMDERPAEERIVINRRTPTPGMLMGAAPVEAEDKGKNRGKGMGKWLLVGLALLVAFGLLLVGVAGVIAAFRGIQAPTPLPPVVPTPKHTEPYLPPLTTENTEAGKGHGAATQETPPVVTTRGAETRNTVETKIPVVESAPRVLTCTTPMPSPDWKLLVGSHHTLNVGAGDRGLVERASSMSLRLQGQRTEVKLETGAVSGTVRVQPAEASRSLKVTFKPTTGEPEVDVVEMTLQRGGTIGVKYPARVLLKQDYQDVVKSVGWLIQNGELALAGTGEAKSPRVVFAPGDAGEVGLMEARTMLRWGLELPGCARPRVEGASLPAGWKWGPVEAPEGKDGYGIYLWKGESDKENVASVLLVISKDFGEIESYFEKQVILSEKELEKQKDSPKWKAAMEAYAELREVTVWVDINKDLPAASVRLTQAPP